MAEVGGEGVRPRWTLKNKKKLWSSDNFLGQGGSRRDGEAELLKF